MTGRRRWILLLIRLIVTAVAVGWVLTRTHPEAALSALMSAPPWLWLVPVSVVSCTTLIQALRLYMVLRATGNRTGYLRVVGALCRGAFVGLALPSGGQEVAKAAFLSRASGRLDAALAALLTVRVLQLPTWVLFLVWGLTWGLLQTHPLLGACAMAFIAVASCVLLASFRGFRATGADEVTLPRWLPARLSALLARVVGALVGLRRNGQVLVWVALLALPCGLLNAGLVCGVAAAFGVNFGLFSSVALIPAADVVIWLPISMSGIGVRETMMVQVFSPLHVAESTAVAIGLARWTGELFRAAVGGILFVLSDTGSANEPDTGRRSEHG